MQNYFERYKNIGLIESLVILELKKRGQKILSNLDEIWNFYFEN